MSVVESQGSTEGSTGSGKAWHCLMPRWTYIAAPKNGWTDSTTVLCKLHSCEVASTGRSAADMPGRARRACRSEPCWPRPRRRTRVAPSSAVDRSVCNRAVRSLDQRINRQRSFATTSTANSRAAAATADGSARPAGPIRRVELGDVSESAPSSAAVGHKHSVDHCAESGHPTGAGPDALRFMVLPQLVYAKSRTCGPQAHQDALVEGCSLAQTGRAERRRDSRASADGRFGGWSSGT